MAKIKNPLLSLLASNTLGKVITFRRSRGQSIVEKKPEVPDAKTLAQLSWRHMYQKAVALWHGLCAAEKESWESQARPKHMTGFAWFMSQALKPNPGLYLPLQGGTMQGIIDMDGYQIESVKDPVANQDGDTKAARDAAIAIAIGGSLTCDVYGWDGGDWRKLLVESAANANLRVALYSGATIIGADTTTSGGINISTRLGFYTRAQTMLQYTATHSVSMRAAYYLSDANAGTNIPGATLFGYNGAGWDRLRTWGTGVLKVGRAEIDSTTVRKTAVGQVKAAAGKLYWFSCNPSAGNSLIEFTDALAGGGAVVFDHFCTAKESHVTILDPPMKFATGIYLETLTNVTSLVFCYV